MPRKKHAVFSCIRNGTGSIALAGNGELTDGEIFNCPNKCSRNGYSHFAVKASYADRGRWKDGCTTYWRNLSALDRMPERKYLEPSGNDHSTVVSYADISAQSKAKLRFVISWNIPVAVNYWKPRQEESDQNNTWRNYYATQFKDSHATAKYALKKFDFLYEKTELFSNALQSCTLPSQVKDAISANLSVIKTPTALRLEDGSFWGWEGCSERAGSCYGTCQHVWNYAYSLNAQRLRLNGFIEAVTSLKKSYRGITIHSSPFFCP